MGRRGFALALVLFALVLLSALSAAALFAALQESRIGRQAVGSLRASWSADRALAWVVARWDAAAYDSLRPGSALRPAFSDPGPEAPAEVEVRRLSSALFLVRALGRDAGSGAERRSAMVVRVDVPELGAAAAVRAHSVAVGIESGVSGTDRTPGGWSCAGAGDSAMAVDLRPSAPDSVLFGFGSWSWERLAAWAAGVAAAGGGDSVGVRYASSSVALTGDRVLGLLVVDGDLTMRAGAEVVGLVLVRGRVTFEGAGGHIVGAVVAGSLELAEGTPPAAASVAFSRCAEEAALLARAPVLPIPTRSLADLPNGVPLR